MVLHIAIEGISGVGKTTITDKLVDFFTKKNYKVRKATQPVNMEIINILRKYNLTTYEIALLMAFDRSFSYYGENWEDYDLVIWDRSVLSSYVYHTDENTPLSYIKQINRYVPKANLYIIIETQDQQDTTEKYHQLINQKNIIGTPYIQDQQDKVFENIIRIIFEKLPRCNWCGRLFTPNNKHKKYCSKKCSKYSLEDQYRINNRNYYNRYKNVMSERQKGGLGSKNANLHGKADPNPLAELEKVRNAKKALGLKPII